MNKSKIQDEIFNDFTKSLKKFYRERQQKYFKNLKEKIEAGEFEEDSYKENAWKEAEIFFKTRPKELSSFIKDYVDSGIDKIKIKLDSGTINKKEADIQFEVLKYILLEGDNIQE